MRDHRFARSDGSPGTPSLTVVVGGIRSARALRRTLAALADVADAEVLVLADDGVVDLAGGAAPARAVVVAPADAGAAMDAIASDFVAVLDAGDLVADDFLVGATAMLADGTSCMAHPEYVVDLGQVAEVRRLLPSDVLDWRDVVRGDPWPGPVVAPRTVWEGVGSDLLSLSTRGASADWSRDVVSAAAGVAHRIVPGTVAFLGVDGGGRAATLPPLDLDALQHRLPVPSPTETGPHRVSRRAVGLARRLAAPLSVGVRRTIAAPVRTLRRVVAARRETAARHVGDSAVLAAVRRLRGVAPELSAMSWIASAPVSTLRDDGYAEVLAQALRDLGDRVGALVAVPWIDDDPARAAAFQYARALHASERFHGRTVILGTEDAVRTDHSLVPRGVTAVHLHPRFPSLPAPAQSLLLGQLIVALGPEIVLTVGDARLPGAVGAHARDFGDGGRLYVVVQGPSAASEVSSYDLAEVSGVLADSTATATVVSELPGARELVTVQPLPVGHSTPELARGTRAYNNEYFSERNPFRVLALDGASGSTAGGGASRIIARLRQRQLPVVAEVWTTGPADSEPATDSAEGVTFRDGFSGDLGPLRTYGYHALLLVSELFGVPDLVADALLRGLPVVAVPEADRRDLLDHRVTGVVAGGADAEEGLVDGLAALMASVDLRRRLIEGGYALAVQRHSWDAFGARVARL